MIVTDYYFGARRRIRIATKDSGWSRLQCVSQYRDADCVWRDVRPVYHADTVDDALGRRARVTAIAEHGECDEW